ncbi:hypothetical protein H5410_021668, partial [Solanum commersonii]
MPQLDKFTYFTQFFWSCLFLILLRFYLPLDLQVKVDFYYITRTKLRRALSILKFFIYLLFLFTFLYKIYPHVFDGILLHSLFGIVPSELLEHYINQPDKDPEWVEIRTTRSTNPGTFTQGVRGHGEQFPGNRVLFSTRDHISSLYQLIYYGREDPQFFIDPQDLDYILMVHLEPFEFNHVALCQVLESFHGDREESPFYAEVKRTQAKHSHGFFLKKQQDQLEMHHRREGLPNICCNVSISMLLLLLSLNKSSNLVLFYPSFYGEQRTKYNRFLHLNSFRLSLFLFLTTPQVVPNVWHFPYFMSETSTNSLRIKLQPKIYDHIMLLFVFRSFH